MRSLNRIGLALLFFVQLSLSGLAQSGIITNYVGPQLPVNGTQAITHAIDFPSSVVSDGALADTFVLESLRPSMSISVHCPATKKLNFSRLFVHYRFDHLT